MPRKRKLKMTKCCIAARKRYRAKKRGSGYKYTGPTLLGHLNKAGKFIRTGTLQKPTRFRLPRKRRGNGFRGFYGKAFNPASVLKNPAFLRALPSIRALFRR